MVSILLQKKVYFYVKLLMQRSFKVSPGCMPSAPLTATDKVEGGLLLLIFGLGFFLASFPLEIFCRRPCY